MLPVIQVDMCNIKILGVLPTLLLHMLSIFIYISFYCKDYLEKMKFIYETIDIFFPYGVNKGDRLIDYKIGFLSRERELHLGP